MKHFSVLALVLVCFAGCKTVPQIDIPDHSSYTPERIGDGLLTISFPKDYIGEGFWKESNGSGFRKSKNNYKVLFSIEHTKNSMEVLKLQFEGKPPKNFYSFKDHYVLPDQGVFYYKQTDNTIGNMEGVYLQKSTDSENHREVMRVYFSDEFTPEVISILASIQ